MEPTNLINRIFDGEIILRLKGLLGLTIDVAEMVLVFGAIYFFLRLVYRDYLAWRAQ